MRLKTNTRALEARIQSSILSYLKTSSGVLTAYRLTAQRRGSPDIVASYKGRFIAFEVKRDKKTSAKPRFVQTNEAKILIQTGGFLFFVVDKKETYLALKVVDSVEKQDFTEALRLLQEFSLYQPLRLELAKVENVYLQRSSREVR